MRPVCKAVIFVLIALVLGLCMAYAMLDTPQHVQLKNAYWPYSVETSVRDR